jgi:hypothetical protein
MKKICFIEAEGVLLPFKGYVPDKERAEKFFEDLSNFCSKNKIEIYILSGFHENVAHKKFDESFLGKKFSKKNFSCVSEEYITSKGEDDETLHRQKLQQDPEYYDSYAKQVFISRVLKEKDLNEKDAILLGEDIWVDGYYTNRFSKVDFAIFEENISDRGVKCERISGLAYFNLNFDSVKILLENFPAVDMGPLDKYVFEIMKKALVGNNLADVVKKGLIKKSAE